MTSVATARPRRHLVCPRRGLPGLGVHLPGDPSRRRVGTAPAGDGRPVHRGRAAAGGLPGRPPRLRALRVTWRQLGSAALVGSLLLLGGNGGVAVGEQTVPSGLAALLVAAMPLWLVCLRLLNRDRPPDHHARRHRRWASSASLCWPARAAPARSRDRDLGPARHRVRHAVLGHRLVPGRPAPDAADAFVATTYEMLIAGLAWPRSGLRAARPRASRSPTSRVRPGRGWPTSS